jgi:subtilisin family serine protease
VEPGIEEGLARGEFQEVLVTLDDSAVQTIAMAHFGRAPQTTQEIQEYIDLRASAFALQRQDVLNAAPKDVMPKQQWANVPVVLVEVRSEAGLQALLARPDVINVALPMTFELTDAQAAPLIGQPAAAADGKTGAGTTVAVLDTGANYAHSDLGNCTAPNTGASCKVVAAVDFATDDSALDDNGHGTNVSAVVLSVAPAAKIAALDVFGAGGKASSVDIVSAINWSIANRATLPREEGHERSTRWRLRR